MSKSDRKEKMRKAVVERLKEIHPQIEMFSGIWDERALEMLVLALGVGQVILND